jgi:hypothetical protein
VPLLDRRPSANTTGGKAIVDATTSTVMPELKRRNVSRRVSPERLRERTGAMLSRLFPKR